MTHCILLKRQDALQWDWSRKLFSLIYCTHLYCQMQLQFKILLFVMMFSFIMINKSNLEISPSAIILFLILSFNNLFEIYAKCIHIILSSLSLSLQFKQSTKFIFPFEIILFLLIFPYFYYIHLFYLSMQTFRNVLCHPNIFIFLLLILSSSSL